MAWKLIIVWAFVFAVCQSAMAQYAAEFNSYHAGKQYNFRLSHEQLANTPYWTDEAPNPPLSVHQAKSIGIDSLSKIFSDGEKWRVSGITLVPVVDRWVFLIVFDEPRPAGCYDCMSSPFSVVVTMDGTAVVPNVSVWKPNGSDSSYGNNGRR